MSPTDLDLLHQFAREHAQDAFTELVRRHVRLVYSDALRQVRAPHLAEEIAQSVFMDLARVAASPASPLAGRAAAPPQTSLTPWLFTVTRRTAVDAIRKESRRQLREQIAAEMNAMNASGTGGSPVWSEIEPLLDEAMAALNETDRAAVLLRYFENKPLRDVGAQLGMTAAHSCLSPQPSLTQPAIGCMKTEVIPTFRRNPSLSDVCFADKNTFATMSRRKCAPSN